MSEGGRHHAIALLVVAFVHAIAAWVLLRDLWPTTARHASPPEPLRVRWLERPRTAGNTPPAPSAPRTGHGRLPPTLAHPSVPSKNASPDVLSGSPEPKADSSPADYAAQAAEWARQAVPAPNFAPSLLDSRTPHLPGGNGQERIRMKEAITPARVVGFIGTLFGDPGNPCPRMRQNVDDSLVDTSEEGRRRLAWELREYRERCRP